ncbi:MAG: outer membrane beta-barrel protein [Verrucomicrobiota bacterium]|jgi:hypothetical protein
MKFNKWTVGLAAVGVVSLASAARADEKMSQVQTALSNTTISGYVSSSFNWAISPGNYQNSPAGYIPYQGAYARGAAAKENGFNLDVVKLSIAKPQDESQYASGYQIDLLFGPDAVGYDRLAYSSGEYAGLAIEQAYIALRTPIGNGIDWKVGVFNSPIGYESFDAVNDPNYTRSWGYAVEPTTFTGVLGSYKLNDQWAVSAGIANTANNIINGRAGDNGRAKDWNKTLMASVSYTAPSSWGSLAGSTLDAGVIYGFGGTSRYYPYHANGNQVNYYGGATLNTAWKPLKLGVALDYVHNFMGGENFTTSYDETDIFVAGVYGTYKATDKLNLNARIEYVKGEFNHEVHSGTSSSTSVDGLSVTGTVDYAMWANVISRLELRWDHLGKDISPLGGFDQESLKEDSIGFYANIIYKF